MTGAVATAIGVGVAGSIAGAGVSAGINALSGSGGGTSAGSSNSSQNDASNAIYGVHVSTQPLQGQGNPNPKPQMMATNSKAIKNTPATARGTPTQGAEQNAANAKSDYQNVWADRLSRYLDYNTRALG